jgi:hypothetical protein
MKVKNNDVRLITLGGGTINLTPGVNQVDDKLWEAAVANPGAVLKHLFKQKLLEVLDAPKGAKAEQAKEPEADEAIALIADTLDRDTLEAWRRGESRKTVLAALDEQLELTKV